MLLFFQVGTHFFSRLLLTVSQMLPKQALRTVSGTDDWFAK